MTHFNNPLDHVRVAAPCNADWDEMIGNDRSRFCGQCSRNVYNLSDMTKAEAERLIARSEGRLCVRFYRRSDGSILTRNCPVGLRALKRRVSAVARAVISLVLSFFTGLTIYEVLSRISTVGLPRRELMGVMALDPPAYTPAPITGTLVQGEMANIPPVRPQIPQITQNSKHKPNRNRGR